MKRINLCRPKTQRLISSVIFFSIICFVFAQNFTSELSSVFKTDKYSTQIVVITPTYRRSTRLADLVRLKNTLTNIKNVYWIIVEDSVVKSPIVKNLLRKSGIPHSQLAYRTVPGYPRRGWYQRDMAIKHLEDHKKEIVGSKNSVIYFADDDNSYDTRLFDEYIRNVRKAGVWGVGLVGGSPVEAPIVENNKVKGWHVSWNPERKFAVDMAGFAISADLVFKNHPRFGTECKKGGGAPETCFLESAGVELSDLQPFGFEVEKKRELLVWHTKTVQVKYDKRKVDLYGYIIE